VTGILGSVDIGSIAGMPFEIPVRRGAGWMDTEAPGWWKRDYTAPIQLKKLDMSDPNRCVLGQVYGSFYPCPPMVRTLSRYGYNPDVVLDQDSIVGRRLDQDILEEYGPRGLALPRSAGMDTWDILTATWRALIQGRRNQFSNRSK